ncbi:hypothetical protein HK405_000716 [Cladochytrium tenue]|nr:hypothetical protein HK405_000716 [Cladochytrium tenue]
MSTSVAIDPPTTNSSPEHSTSSSGSPADDALLLSSQPAGPSQPLSAGIEPALLTDAVAVPSSNNVKPEPTVASSIKAALLANWYLNIAALIFFPLGIVAHVLQWGTVASFVINFLAIIPLAKCLDFATDQLSMRVGETLGGLLNASFGNAVELIMGVITLKAGLLRVLQASLIGSILSNLLLVLGFCFFFGGLIPFKRGKVQKFSMANANLDTGLLAVVSLGFIVPATLSAVTDNENGVILVSRVAAILLLLTYVTFLIFHLYTNPENLQKKEETDVMSSTSAVTHFRRPGKGTHPSRVGSSAMLSPVGSMLSLPGVGEAVEEEEEEKEQPVTLMWVAAAELLIVTVLIAVSAEFLVDSLDGLSEVMPETFIGIILLPIAGNAAEHVTAVSSAIRGKMDLAIEVSIGSSMQIALFVTPLLVLVGWIIGQPLTLNFETFETVVLFATVFVVNALIQDGESHWLEGWMLLASYIMIGVAFYFV